MAYLGETPEVADGMRTSKTVVVVVMGVSGSGKTTIGRLLASRLHWDFIDADDFHTRQNKQKMQHGIALTEEDRIPWLEILARMIKQHREKQQPLVLACSALRKSYREKLGVDQAEVITVYLKVERDDLAKRLRDRKHSFFNPTLLNSQLAALEEPDSGIIIPITLQPEEAVKQIIHSMDQ